MCSEVKRDLLEDSVRVHVHCERGEIEHQFIVRKFLLDGVRPEGGDDRQTDEQMEVAGPIVRPARFPDLERAALGELSLEAEQNPAMHEEQMQRVPARFLQMLEELGLHQLQKLPQVLLTEQQNSWQFVPNFAKKTGFGCT